MLDLNRISLFTNWRKNKFVTNICSILVIKTTLNKNNKKPQVFRFVFSSSSKTKPVIKMADYIQKCYKRVSRRHCSLKI